jgi:hypothetical protein
MRFHPKRPLPCGAWFFMACEILSIEGAVFVLWGKPSKRDLDRVFDRVELIASATGRPIVFIARIPKSAPAPDDEARAHMNALMPRFIAVCSSYHAVLEGSGFVSAIKRAMLAGLFQFGFRNGTFFVHENVKSIVGKVDREQRATAEAILALAEKKGLLTAAPPEDSPLLTAAGTRRNPGPALTR